MPAPKADHRPSFRIALFNVKYSPNLGDGILSECLEAEIRRVAPDCSVLSLDLAGRRDYASGGRFRSITMTILEHCPAFVRHLIVTAILGASLRLRLRPRWHEALKTVDAVVVGGGNLFGDSDLNFPLKIDAALAETRAAALPAAVFGVGVSDNWSSRGEVLFRRALAGVRLVYASVREQRSAAIWNARLGGAGIRSACIGRDPGLLVSDHGPRRRDGARREPLVGIGLTHPLALRYHSASRFEEATMTAWFTDLVRCCTARGWRVALFTNGSSEDNEYLARVGPLLTRSVPEDKVTVLPRFLRPMDLAGFIAGLDLLMAHRLHANCTAYSYAIPHIGFSWDEKLESFFGLVGRSQFVCTAGLDTAEHVVTLGDIAMRQGIDPDRHAATLAACRSDLADLVAALRAALPDQTKASWLPTPPSAS